MAKSKIRRIVPELDKEMQDILNEKNYHGRGRFARSQRDMVDYCKVGREAEKIRDKFILRDIFGKKKKRKR